MIPPLLKESGLTTKNPLLQHPENNYKKPLLKESEGMVI